MFKLWGKKAVSTGYVSPPPKLLGFRKSNRFQADLALACSTPRLAADTKNIWRLLEILRTRQQIPREFRPHPMKGDWAGWWDCHVGNDLVLVWRYKDEQSNGEKMQVIELAALGTHAYLQI